MSVGTRQSARPRRMVLPLGRRGRARTSLEGTFAHQVQQAEQEPGVRRQLYHENSSW